MSSMLIVPALENLFSKLREPGSTPASCGFTKRHGTERARYDTLGMFSRRCFPDQTPKEVKGVRFPAPASRNGYHAAGEFLN
jgi:hypothetical protein